MRMRRALATAACLGVATLGLSACGGTQARKSLAARPGAAGASINEAALPSPHPQVVQPVAGQQAAAAAPQAPSDPVGDPTAHAPPLSQVKAELKLELVAVKQTNATYVDPLQYVTVWGRTDQGVDAQMPVGAPILAPCRVKILDVIPNWYAGQPLVYYELLEGPEAGQVQYVAEQITDIAPIGSFLSQGQAIARYAPSGTAIEFGWSTLDGVTLARATTGYEEGQVTPAGQSIRDWLDALGANAGKS